MTSDGEWLNWYESGWVQVETLWGSVCIHSLVARLHQLQQPAVYQLSHITYIAFHFMENSVFRKLIINVYIRDFALLLIFLFFHWNNNIRLGNGDSNIDHMSYHMETNQRKVIEQDLNGNILKPHIWTIETSQSNVRQTCFIGLKTWSDISWYHTWSCRPCKTTCNICKICVGAT